MPSIDPERILLAGDWHGNTLAARTCIDAAAAVGASVVVQLGDFGFWPRTERGRSFLRKTSLRAVERDVLVLWVDGNHEDLRALRDWRHGDWTQPLEVAPAVWHMPRGFRTTWGGITWLWCGGAVSVDRASRVEGVDYFPQEEVTRELVEQIVADGPAHVVVAHDAPFGLEPLYTRYQQRLPPWRREAEWPVSELLRSDAHQRRMRHLMEGILPQFWFCGHHHTRVTGQVGSTTVEVLDMDLAPLAARSLLVGADGPWLDR